MLDFEQLYERYKKDTETIKQLEQEYIEQTAIEDLAKHPAFSKVIKEIYQQIEIINQKLLGDTRMETFDRDVLLAERRAFQFFIGIFNSATIHKESIEKYLNQSI